MFEPGEPSAKRIKADETEKILNQIERKEIEVVEWKGRSAAWKKFVKLRSKLTDTFIDYVQCNECKALRLYSRKNGTSTLNSHKCHSKDGNDETIFKEISAVAAAELKVILTQKLVEFCAEDVVPVSMFGGTGFVRFVQNIAAITEKYGVVDFRKVFPNVTAVHQSIQNVKKKHELQIAEKFERALTNDWCSLTMSAWETDMSDKQILVTVNASLFSENLTALSKSVLFTVPVQANGDKLMTEISKKLKTFGCDESKIHHVNIVTPGEEIYVKMLHFTGKRENCISFIINSILQTSLRCSGNEIKSVLDNCKETVSYIMETNSKLPVVEDIGTWKSKVKMINSLTCQYNDVINLLNAEEKHELKFKKTLAEELAQVLQIFAEAIEDLQSTTHTTINKILPWYYILLDHLNSKNEYSIEIQLFMHQAKSAFKARFIPNMTQKVACFLDPRFKLLKMLSDAERAEVTEEIKLILRSMPTDVMPVAKEPGETTDLQKKSRFSRFEVDDQDIGETDEFNIYVHSIQLKDFNFDEEFNIVGQFWKKHEQKLPKLFKLATTRLHVPASCCGGSKPFQRDCVQLDHLEELILVRDNLRNKK